MINQEKIKEQIAFHIKHSGITQTKLAKAIGVKQQTISEYVKGISAPSLETLAKLCVVLDVSADEILCIDTLIGRYNQMTIDQKHNKGTINNNF